MYQQQQPPQPMQPQQQLPLHVFQSQPMSQQKNQQVYSLPQLLSQQAQQPPTTPQLTNPSQQMQEAENMPTPYHQALASHPSGTVLEQNSQESNQRFEAKPRAQMKRLSICQIVFGAVCLLFGLILVAAQDSWISRICYGVWGGGFILSTGLAGLAAVSWNNFTWIRAAMILNFVNSAVFVPLFLAFSSFGILEISDIYYYPGPATFMAFNSLFVLICIVELGINIMSTIHCYRAVGCFCEVIHLGRNAYNTTSTIQTNQQNLANSRAFLI
ncbi:uncharacterized protein [Watersipora subatra]|uniref:uncharacterized protein n=1 Tax=Watersipora subatra TaxID=2589382 RepID=UPI00355C5F47